MPEISSVPVSHQFTIAPLAISAGETASMCWHVEGAARVLLGGREVAPDGCREIMPERTTGYRLHIELPDGSFTDLDAILKVTPAALEEAPPGPTRPPTVLLTPANTEHLRGYPRPPSDNGIGLHFHPDLADDLIVESVEHLSSIHATWTLIFAQDELKTEKAAAACFRAGIMPVIRIGRLIDESFDPTPFIEGLRKALKASGFPHDPANPPLYVQVYNEPEDEREWRSGRPSNWAEIFGRNWASQAARVYDSGAYPGIQVLDRPGFDAAVDSVNAINRRDLWQRAFFVHHNYGQNHPPGYPYDLSGVTILQDHIAALKFLAHAVWMQERLGMVLPLIGGEGGWWPGNEEDRRYPKVDWTLHAEYTRQMFDWLRSGVLSNGEPTPDYLFSITAWVVKSWTFPAQNWWGNILSPDGKLTQTIEAVSAMSQFVRRFSWGADGEPPVKPVVTPDEPPVKPVVTPDEPPVKPVVTPDGPITSPDTPPEWDARLDALGVQLTRSADPKAWRLVSARFQGPDQAAELHHVFLNALAADGSPVTGIRFVVDWLGRRADESPGYAMTDEKGECNVPIFITLHPAAKDGIQFAKVADAPSDVVTGLGLPDNQNVRFVLTFHRP